MRSKKKDHSGDESLSGRQWQRKNRRHETTDTFSLHNVKQNVNLPAIHLSEHALDVLLILAEALGDLPREYYSTQLVSITARVGDLVFEVYQLSEDIAALTESEVAA